MANRYFWLGLLLLVNFIANLVLYHSSVQVSRKLAPTYQLAIMLNCVDDQRTSPGIFKAPMNNTNNIAVSNATSHATRGAQRTTKSVTISVAPVFSYVILPESPCSRRNVDLLIGVPVRRSNTESRMAIRQTWGSVSKTGIPVGNTPKSNISLETVIIGNLTNLNTSNVVLIFFIGSASSPDAEGQKKLESEAKMYGDIVQEDYADTYANLTLKSLSLLRWATQYCAHARYVAKIDDDMYINSPLLLNYLIKVSDDKRQKNNKTDAPAFIAGRVFREARVIRKKESKWYTPLDVYKGQKYPTYASGTAYAMSGPAANLLYQSSKHIPVFWMEDIYITGMCARDAGVELVTDTRFSHLKRKTSGCVFKTNITGHGYSVTEMFQIHSELYNSSLKCG